ncbi:MAG: DNA adenine methylase, partial [Bacteroidia bacterium]|nr:DNA adenine methylase [Bacteroidia bacterium]
DQLSKLKGKFLLSSFPSEILDEYIEKNGWYTIAFDKVLAASKSTSGKTKPRKVEVLTANYPIA